MDIWFSSDWHLGHKKIQQFCPTTRSTGTVEEMNELLVETHNKHVKKGDMFFHLGDFSFLSSAATGGFLSRMNGQKHFIRGNHDASTDSKFVKLFLASYRDYDFRKIKGHKVALMHYPIESWQEQHHGSLHLHGHTHGNTSFGRSVPVENRLDVGIDNRKQCDMAPFNFDEILEILKVEPKC